MKCKVMSVQNGVSKKSNKPYCILWVMMPTGSPCKVFDMSGRDFSGIEFVELGIDVNYNAEPRVVIK